MKSKKIREIGLLGGLAVVCLMLIGGLIYQLGVTVFLHEVCSIDVGDDTVTVFRIGWASLSGQAKFLVAFNDISLLEYDCVGDFMTTPCAAISSSAEKVFIKSVGGDNYEIAMRIDLTGDKQSVSWCYMDSESQPVSITDAENRMLGLSTIKALAESVQLSYHPIVVR